VGLLDLIIGKKVYLDRNIFIYAVEGYDEFSSELNLLFTQFDKGILQAVTSELTLANEQ
jgi:predicted nucleic acid-binding protein